ncbi:DNA-binding transcriptional MerR regulator [Hamadaea flava]|uniref:MerR family transcriptional regulator n=1 Tax=Hamadaea flava TaxID=1742688 RepID=A0ABV8LTP3_9ACTN|nr:MerR family transcriptional regulator [Hamadaea flava]MCP2321750.1 DNA-binding transcriptional MerR regulator [Hamadaea flava]
MSHTVGQVAELAGVTVRTLHHYDEIGLLTPGGRTSAGYRRYDAADLDRLQQILLYRELGFSLEEIAVILDDPDADAREHLRRQHRLLTGRIARLREMVAAVEYVLEAQKVGIDLTPEEKFEVFGDFDPDQYAAEAEQRWGGTDAYAESARRTQRYTKEDWLRIQQETADLLERWIAAYDAGVPADSEAGMALAEEHRQQLSKFFYDCTFEIHTGLAEMYLADERFTRNYDQHRPGLAQYVHDTIVANAITRA